MTENKKTPLWERHQSLGARLVPFGGWEMPVQYAGLRQEHEAVRKNVGLFDVSHMGEIRLSGPTAYETLQNITSNDISGLVDGQCQYTAFPDEKGCPVDDLLIYRFGPREYWLVVNAGNTPEDFQWVKAHLKVGTEAKNESDSWGQVALQGPDALTLLAPHVDLDMSAMKYYHFDQGTVFGVKAVVSRTGYTGEDGFEVYTAPQDIGRVWDRLLEKGATPCGLGSRDTLRLEAAMNLYGNDMDRSTTLWEAGLGWIVKLGKGDFIGKEALTAQKEVGIPRRLVGFQLTGKGIARHGYPVGVGDTVCGHVGSGTLTPTVGKSIGMAYLPSEYAKIGTSFWVEIRRKKVSAEVIKKPFYRREG